MTSELRSESILIESILINPQIHSSDMPSSSSSSFHSPKLQKSMWKLYEPFFRWLDGGDVLPEVSDALISFLLYLSLYLLLLFFLTVNFAIIFFLTSL